MPEKLACSNNSLADLIKWSKWGYVIILNTSSKRKFFSRPEFKTSNKIVSLNLSRQWECLMNEGEWPDYLIEYGCQEISNEDVVNLDLTNMVEFSM